MSATTCALVQGPINVTGGAIPEFILENYRITSEQVIMLSSVDFFNNTKITANKPQQKIACF